MLLAGADPVICPPKAQAIALSELSSLSPSRSVAEPEFVPPVELEPAPCEVPVEEVELAEAEVVDEPAP